HQVKIRGYRIELGEIESQLLKHSDVQQAVVLDKTDDNGQRYLNAYFSASREVPVSEWRTHLLASLPDYMVPGQFIRVEAIPLTPSGKADRRALAEMEGLASMEKEYTGPRNEMEAALCVIWEQVLGIERIGIEDNFFEHGINSLMMIMIEVELEKIGIRLKELEVYKAIHDHPTIKDFSVFIAAKLEPSNSEERHYIMKG
ncbi:AMP-binding enzyme, partial [Paenibacillus radicis (ex Gao et al. 2016)]|uniref:AMP-binding enzyme n=1 Tax=Paenibacillus radicis (ex Gao et al. 2016) TaxID=1737354 RepID=UPI001667A25D